MTTTFNPSLAVAIEAGLESIKLVERVVQVQGGAATCLEPSPENLRTFFLAFLQEGHELLNEFPAWKPWKKSHEVDEGAMAGEAADILAFFGLILHYMEWYNVTPRVLAEAFVKKSQINIERLNGRVPQYGWGGESKTA